VSYTRAAIFWCLSLVLVACSGGTSDRKLRVGNEADDKGGGSAGFGSGAGQVDGGAIGTGNEALSVRVQDPDEMTIEVITLACAGDCADVEAVARGGNHPYAFTWEDGSENAKRRVCLGASTTLEVTATDTAIQSEEFQYDAQTATSEVTATVLTCSDGGVPTTDDEVPQASCGPDATPAFKVIDKVPSTPTATFAQANGNLADYVASTFGGGPLAIVGQVTRTIHRGLCTKLLLASDAAGTKAVGWDDSLIVEYRSTPGGPVDARWYYGTVNVTYTPDNQMLPSVQAPTVAGSSLDPPVPNFAPFGYEPLAINLMDQIPNGADGFELTLYILDAATVGSTTEIWVIPQ
jgi:hypothetical protein